LPIGVRRQSRRQGRVLPFWFHDGGAHLSLTTKKWASMIEAEKSSLRVAVGIIDAAAECQL
jgi:hypothetical protein